MALLLLHFALLALLALLTNAQVTPCLPSLCPDPQHCIFGNSTLTSIGITPLITNLTFPLTSTTNTASPQALAWTLGTSSLYLPESSSNATFTKSYYLSVPPSINITGCALFFEGAAATGEASTANGSCAGIGSQCVSDLEGISANVIENLGHATGEGGVINRCDALQAMLETGALGSCGGADWGVITVRDLAALKRSQISNSGSCYPTLQRSYALSLVNTYQESIEYDKTSEWEAFMNATTPVLTLLDNGSGKFEAGLRCLRTVEAPAVPNSGTGKTSAVQHSGSGRAAASCWMVVFMLVLLGVVYRL